MATNLTGPTSIPASNIGQSSATAQGTIGSVAYTADGRKFRYVKNGGTATVVGKVYQGPAKDSTNLSLSGGLTVAAAAAIGATSLSVSDTLTNAANVVAGGFMSVVAGTGIGYVYKVRSNSAVTAAAGMTIQLEDPLVLALDTTSRIILVKHPQDGVVVEPGTPTASIAGVATYIIPANNYGWLQVGGPCAVLFTGTGVAGKAVGSLSGGTSGSSAPAIAATNILGYHMATGITGEYSMIDLAIPC
jgi:hypothetical protein